MVSALPILSVVANVRKTSEHTKRIPQAPMFLQVPMAKSDLQRLFASAALVPGYFQRIKTAFETARLAVGETGLHQGLQSVRLALAAIRLLIADVR